MYHHVGEPSTSSIGFPQKIKIIPYKYATTPSTTMILRKKRLCLSKWIKVLYLFLTLAWVYYILTQIYISHFNDYDYGSEDAIDALGLEETPTAVPDEENSFHINFKDVKLKYQFVSDGFDCDEKKKLLIMIPSRPEGFQKRMAIRNSWLKNMNKTVTYRFVLGQSNTEATRESNLQESLQFNDVIITDLIDSYPNLTLKTHALMTWQQRYCPNVEFVLKTDDDTVVSIPRLLYWIDKDFKNMSKNAGHKVVIGKVWNKVVPKRNPKNKWYTPRQAWGRRYFPDYCNGPTYLLTPLAITLILNQAPNYHFITVEDALFTGILAEAAKVQRIDRWKNFGLGPKIKTECDENGIPHLISIYDIGKDEFKFDDAVPNAFTNATKTLSSLSCSKKLFDLL